MLRLKNKADRPCVLLVSKHRGQELVAKHCDRAAAAGVREGQSLSHAKAILTEDPIIQPFRPDKAAKALRQLGDWVMMRFTPVVTVDPPNGLLLDISGCGHLFSGDACLAACLVEQLLRLGIQACIAIAKTYAAARMIAMASDQVITVVPDDHLRETLSRLPTWTLGGDSVDERLPQRTLDDLHEVGIDHVGHLMNLPRHSIASRFDDLLERLDQATGRLPQVVVPLRYAPKIKVCREFDGPVRNLEGLLIATEELLELLAKELADLESGVLRMDLSFVRPDEPREKLSIVLNRPNRDPKHLWRIIRPRVERVNMGFGIESINIVATNIELIAHEQMSYGSHKRYVGNLSADEALAQFLDQVTDRLGVDRVLRIEMQESHIPEQAFRTAPVSEKLEPQDAPLICEHDRPSILFPCPEPVTVTHDQASKITAIDWRGERHRITTCVGPQRISPEWWADHDPTYSARDYYKIGNTHGLWLWLFHELKSDHWQVHGMWG